MARELYVGHLPENTTEEDLWKLFSVAGTVTSVHLIIDPETGEFKRCGYVRMLSGVDLKEVVDTLDGAYLIDREIHVSIARPQKPGMGAAAKTLAKKPWLKGGPKPSKSAAKPGAVPGRPQSGTKPSPGSKPSGSPKPRATSENPASGRPAPSGRPGREGRPSSPAKPPRRPR